MSSTLEHNVSPVLGRDFKMRMVDLTRQLAVCIAGALVDVPEAQAFEVVAGTYARVAGLWPMSNPPAELGALLVGPELSHTRISFRVTLRRMLQALLIGLTQADSGRADELAKFGQGAVPQDVGGLRQDDGDQVAIGVVEP